MQTPTTSPTPSCSKQAKSEHCALVSANEAQHFVGRRLKVLNLCQSEEELNTGVDFFSWHGAMTRARREARG